MSETIIRSRIDASIKSKATKLFEHMGLSLSEAIRIFLYQSIAEEGLPFRITLPHQPNMKTKKVLQDIAKNPELLEETSITQLRKDWES